MVHVISLTQIVRLGGLQKKIIAAQVVIFVMADLASVRMGHIEKMVLLVQQVRIIEEILQ
tara:strand:- start:25413 stop:25592 length:180 start_codon:yes stop_codon:yes gene_type:complete